MSSITISNSDLKYHKFGFSGNLGNNYLKFETVRTLVEKNITIKFYCLRKKTQPHVEEFLSGNKQGDN